MVLHLVLTDESFLATVCNGGFFIVDFWAPWCGPCKQLSPVIDELAVDFEGRVSFGKLNIDECHDTAAKYDVMSIPTLLVFRDGKLLDRIVGAMPKENIAKKIEGIISK